MLSQAQIVRSLAKNEYQVDPITQLRKELYDLKLDFSFKAPDVIDSLTAKIKKLYIATYDRIAELKSDSESINFKTAVQPLIDLSIYIGKAYSLCDFSKRVHPNEEVREASAKATEELESIRIECEQREDVFQVLNRYQEGVYQKEKPQLHPEEVLYFNQLFRDYKRNGLLSDDKEKKARIIEINKAISALAIEFEKNIDEEKTSFNLTKKELEGLPENWFNKEREVSQGVYKVTLQYPDIFPILDYAVNRSTREKIFVAFESRCAKENIPILKKIIALRQENAALLSYKNHADYIAETRLVKTAENIRIFLEEMNARFTPLLENNLTELTNFVREMEKDESYTLQLYDFQYYQRLQKEKLLKIDSKEVLDYFPVQKVISGTLKIYEQLLGLTFVKTERSTWQSDVLVYEVHDKKDKKCIGMLYLDLYPREGKYGHAAAFSLLHGCDVSHIENKANACRVTEVALVCNFDQNKPIPFNDVTTFFHEFGHGMHFICSETKLPVHNGRYVEMDFIEAPSQMLENWCYEAKALELLSEHPETKESLSFEQIRQIQDSEKIHIAYEKKRQLVYAYFDYLIYTLSDEEINRLDVDACFGQIHQKILGLPTVNGTSPAASFSHTVSGYDAGYYGYLMSETYAQAMYEKIFKSDPLSSSAGEKYRQCILRPGATKNAMELLCNFLGEQPKLDAFLKKCGLNPSASPQEAKGGEECVLAIKRPRGI